MFALRYRLLALTLTATLAASGCSDDAGANNDTAANNGDQDVNQGPLNDAGSDAADEEDTSTDTGADTAEEDEDTSAAPPAVLPDFAYLKPDLGSGVSVNIVAGRVGKIENSYERTEMMTDAEIDALEADILTEATRDKMVQGWDCGDATTDSDGTRWVFEGRALVDAEARDYQEFTLNVSGCVGEDSTEADAARVQEIIAHLDELRANHFQD